MPDRTRKFHPESRILLAVQFFLSAFAMLGEEIIMALLYENRCISDQAQYIFFFFVFIMYNRTTIIEQYNLQEMKKSIFILIMLHVVDINYGCLSSF